MTFPLRIDILNKLQGKRDKPAKFWPIFGQFSGFFEIFKEIFGNSLFKK